MNSTVRFPLGVASIALSAKKKKERKKNFLSLRLSSQEGKVGHADINMASKRDSEEKMANCYINFLPALISLVASL